MSSAVMIFLHVPASMTYLLPSMWSSSCRWSILCTKRYVTSRLMDVPDNSSIDVLLGQGTTTSPAEYLRVPSSPSISKNFISAFELRKWHVSDLVYATKISINVLLFQSSEIRDTPMYITTWRLYQRFFTISPSSSEDIRQTAASWIKLYRCVHLYQHHHI